MAELSAPASDPVTASAPPPNLAGLQFATLVATPGSSLGDVTQGDALPVDSSDAQLELIDSILGDLAKPSDDDDFDLADSTLTDSDSDNADADDALAVLFDEVTDWRYSL